MIGLGIGGHSRAAPIWWPPEAAYSIDFVAGQFMQAGNHVARSSAVTFSRPSAGWVAGSAGAVLAFGENEMRVSARGLCVEAARSRLSLAPLDVGGLPWTDSGAELVAILEPEGMFSRPCRLASDGTLYAHRKSAPVALESGQTVRVKVRYRAGSSSQFGIYMLSGPASSLFQGPVGNLVSTTTAAGAWANPVNANLGGGLYEVEVDFIANATAANWILGVSPRSATPGQHVDVLGAMIVDGAGPTQWIFGDPDAPFTRQAEKLWLHLPPGTHDLTLGFDDAATQLLPAVSGDVALSAAVLAGRFLRTATATPLAP